MSPRVCGSVGLIALLAIALALVGCSRESSDDVETVSPTHVSPAPTEGPDGTEPEGVGEATEAGAAEPAGEGEAAEEGEQAAEPGPAGPATEPAAGGPGPRREGGPPGGPPEGGRQGRGGRMFERFDTDADGALSKDEMPERMREHMMEADADKDGKVTREELDAARERGDFGPPRRPGGEGGRGRGGGPPGGGGPEEPPGS